MSLKVGALIGDFRLGHPVGAEGPDSFGKTGHHLGESGRFGRGDPFDGKAIRVDTGIFKDDANDLGAGQGFVITVQVMAFTQVSAHDDHAVSPALECFDHQVGVHHARAHDPHGAHVGRILQARDAGQVPTGIGAPVAQKSKDDRLIRCLHVGSFLLERPNGRPIRCFTLCRQGRGHLGAQLIQGKPIDFDPALGAGGGA